MVVGNRERSSSGIRDGKLTYILRAPEKQHRFGVTALALGRGGSSVFTAGRDGTVREWNSVPTRASDAYSTFSGTHNSLRTAEGAHKTFEEHVDWVNDIALLHGGERLVSCSSDTTIKVWNTALQGRSLRTLSEHTDYVKALACVPSNRVASASLDGRVIVWDLVTGRVQMQCGADTERKPSPSSIYCLSGSCDMHTLVAGSTDRCISVYDSRTGERVVRLRGHSDSIRCVQLRHDGMQMLSGSTDTTVKLWDLRQERCIRSFDSYTSDSIWALAANRSFDRFLSGGRDGTVWQFCLQSGIGSNVVEQADMDARSNMVLDLALSEDLSAVWVSTTGSAVRLWRLPPLSQTAELNGISERKMSDVHAPSVNHPTPPPRGESGIPGKPLFELRGLAGIIAYKIMNDRRHVLTCDARKEYCIWDITRGVSLKQLDPLRVDDTHDIDQVAKMNDHEVSVPSWFTVDIRLGSLAVHLNKKTAFSAEIYAVDAGLEAESEEVKVNIGEHVMRGLFNKWLELSKDDHSEDDNHANGMKNYNDDGVDSRTQPARGHNLPPYEFPNQTPVIVTDGSSPVPVLLKRVGSFDGREECFMPEWVVELVRHNRAPSRTVEKMAFSLHPADGSDLSLLQTTALNAPKVLRVRKVASYIAEHLPEDCDIEDTELEIMCNGQPVPPNMSLATVSQFRWKGPEDLKLHYARKKT